MSQDLDSNIELNVDQQKDRLNILQMTIAFILLMNGTILLILNQNNVASTHQIVINNLTKIISDFDGFPGLHLALIYEEGFIKDLPLQSWTKNISLPSLQVTQESM